MKNILNVIFGLLMIATLMGCSETMADEEINMESLELNTKWMGTYKVYDSFPSVELQIIRYEDGSGKYIRKINSNSEENVYEGEFHKITENKVKDESNDVMIMFSDENLMIANFISKEVELSYEKISPLIEEDFKLSNGIYKGMEYDELKTRVAIDKEPELSGGAMNIAEVEKDGILISLQSNTESVEESSVFGYRIKSGNIKTFRGIGIGDSVENVFKLYGERELFGNSSFIKYELGQYTLGFYINDREVKEILCVNNIIF